MIRRNLLAQPALVITLEFHHQRLQCLHIIRQLGWVDTHGFTAYITPSYHSVLGAIATVSESIDYTTER